MRAARNNLAFVFTGNDRYARGLAVAMYSTLTHLSASIAPEIYILDDGLSEPIRARLDQVIARVGASEAVRKVTMPARPFGARGGAAAASSPTYLRLLIGELLPSHITRAVYLDADVLVRQDLASLFTVDLDGAALGAVRDYAIATTAHPWSGLQVETQPRTYFNAGVLVIDVERWRAGRLGDRALGSVEALGARPAWDDQGALNAVVERWHELDRTWNVQLLNLAVVERLPTTEQTQQLVAQRRTLMRAGAVLHFIGPKPWSSKSTVRGTGAWVMALLRTGWYSPVGAVLWLVPWLAMRTPRRWIWLIRRSLARVRTSPSAVRGFRRRLPRRRSPVAS